jgi:hypothetical protein
MDNWRHRSQGMKCRTCMWFLQKPPSEGQIDYGSLMTKQAAERGAMGRCRRHAPTMRGFPVVFESDWCGDHKLSKNSG